MRGLLKHIQVIKKQFLIIPAAYLLVALLAPVLANRDPLILVQAGQWSFPSFSNSPYVEIFRPEGEFEQIRKDVINWSEQEPDFILFAPVRYDPEPSDLQNSNYVSPFEKQYAQSSRGHQVSLPWSKRHWLGTTKTGSDVLSGIIYGTRYDLMIGLGAVLIAAVIGIAAGVISGYFGDRSLRMPLLSLLLCLLLIPVSWLASFGNVSVVHGEIASLSFLIRLLILFLIPLLPFIFYKFLGNIPFPGRKMYFPVDSIISRGIEIFLSLPRLVLIITLAAVMKPSAWNIIIIIGCTSWTEIARLIRAEVLKLRTQSFVDSARVAGFPALRIFFRHILPNALIPASVVMVFAIAVAILTEAGLSFLGIGVPYGTVTWGTLLFDGKENFSAWWLVLFPGIAIFGLVWSLNNMGDHIRSIYSRNPA
ncbi:MAG: ABC transporter permease [Bacteroidia bacterium]|nr:ABC transporter permease [Bacteroidia bacterium]